MKNQFEKVTIIKLRKQDQQNLNADLQWFSQTLGLFGERDKEKSCFRVFVELVKAARKRRPLTSDEIATKSNLSRATVIHHLTKLIETGLVISQKNYYLLRSNNLENLIGEIEKDTMRIFDDLKEIAGSIDEQLGLVRRENKTVI